VDAVYRGLDLPVFAFIKQHRKPEDVDSDLAKSALTDRQKAEIKRYLASDFDVVLGMLERRIDGPDALTSKVRQAVATALRGTKFKPATIHRSLMRLSAYFSPSWTAFQAERGRDFSVIVDGISN
jgi:hypothetical protein